MTPLRIRRKSLADELGAEAANTLARVTELADYIITVVTDDAAMREIFSDDGGDSLLTGAEGKLFINCATITPQTHVDVEALAEKRGAQSLEGCMASSITQAREGTLYLMCGGKEAAFNQARQILNSMSVSLRYIGEAGQAAQVKALVNMVMNINTAGLAEGLGLGAALGLDLAMLQEVFAQTGANSRVLETDGEDMENRDHECYFSSAHASKDSGIALDLAESAGSGLGDPSYSTVGIGRFLLQRSRDWEIDAQKSCRCANLEQSGFCYTTPLEIAYFQAFGGSCRVGTAHHSDRFGINGWLPWRAT